MVVAISLAYVTYGGLWWMQALFYAIGATVIAIIAITAYKLARSTNKRDPLLWGIFALLTLVTVWAQAELAEFFILAGLVVLLMRAWPGWKRGLLVGLGGVALGLAIWLLEAWLRQAGTAADSTDVLAQILLFFTKAGAFVFGSGLAIIPFLQQGVVQQFGWLNEHQFLDAVVVAMITPGPVVITVAFIGFPSPGWPVPSWQRSASFCRSICLPLSQHPGSNATETTPSLKHSLMAPRRQPPARSPAQWWCWARGQS